ncbi:hypothetical protein DFAR_190005 [Desulfarculales bacterium]
MDRQEGKHGPDTHRHGIIQAEGIETDGPCSAGHQVGDKFILCCWDTDELCGSFYHDIFPVLSLIQFGGQYPETSKDHQKVRHCDKNINFTIVICRQVAG